MPTVIDALIVTLGLDPSNFTQAQKDAAEALDVFDRKVEESTKKRTKAAQDGDKADTSAMRAKETAQKTHQKEIDQKARAEKDARAKQVKEEREAARERVEGYKLVRDAVLGFRAAIAAIGVEKLISGTVTDIADLSRASHNLGMSTDEVAAWGQAIEKAVGGSASDALGTLQNVTGMLVRMRTMGDMSLVGLTNSLEKFGHKQFNMNGPDGKPIGAEDFLKEIASYSSRIDPKQFNELLSRYGIDQGSINFVGQGIDKVNSDIAEQYKNGHLPTKQDELNSKELQAETVALAQAFLGLERQLTFSFAPGLTQFTKFLTSFMKLITGNESWADFKKDGKQSRHDYKVNQYISKGMSPEDAEKAATEDDAKDPAGFGFIYHDADVAPTGTTETPDNGGWLDWAKKRLGIHTFQRNPGGAAPNSAGSPEDVQAYVREDAQLHGINPDIAAALFKTEAGGYNNKSPAGAFGPAQLMKGTAGDLGVATSVNDPSYNWRDNADAGLRYYAILLKKLHSDKAAQAAYNAGEHGPGMKQFIETGDRSGLPKETQNYLRKIQDITGPGAYSDLSRSSNNDNSVSNESHIGQVHIHGVDTNNTKAIGNAIRPILGGQSTIANSDMGMV